MKYVLFLAACSTDTYSMHLDLLSNCRQLQKETYLILSDRLMKQIILALTTNNTPINCFEIFLLYVARLIAFIMKIHIF